MTDTTQSGTQAASTAASGDAATQVAAAANTATAATTLLGADAAKTADATATATATSTADANKATADAAKAVTGAPEKYTDFTVPEGTQVDATALAAFQPVLKDLNLTQDQAQKLVNIYAEQNARAVTDFSAKLKDPAFAVEQAGTMLATQREAWATAVKSDPAIGGANFDANIQTAQRAMARFASPELKSLLNTTGLGNHPELVKLFVGVGKQIREDNPEYGTSGAGRKSNAEVFYSGSAATGA